MGYTEGAELIRVGRTGRTYKKELTKEEFLSRIFIIGRKSSTKSIPIPKCLRDKKLKVIIANMCILCGKEFKKHGNNASPIAIGYCCDKCNKERVIPTRQLLNKNI